jgi:hypothetical protein
VRTIIELVKNRAHYTAKYTRLIGPLNEAVRRACRNNSFSELYELVALASVLQCEVQSVYPYIDYRAEMKSMNTVYKPIETAANTHGRLIIFWTSCQNEVSTKSRPGNGGVWSPNHFVPLLRQCRAQRATSTERTHATAEVEHELA